MDKEYDYINPTHYKNGDKEVWEMMVELWGKDLFISFCEMNIFKYRMRIGKKPENSILQEMNKIKWYEEKVKQLKQ